MHVKKTLYYKNLHLNQLEEEEYEYLISIGMLYVFFPEATGIMKNDLSRVDVIGQNGNDGLHYKDNPDGVDWPHKWEDGYAEKIEKLYNVNSEEEYIPPKDGMFEEPDYEANEICRGHDMISNPRHYTLDGLDVQVIDVIDAVLNSKEAKAWLTPFEGGQYTGVLERLLRAPKKDSLQDLRKAYKQLGWLITSLEGYE